MRPFKNECKDCGGIVQRSWNGYGVINAIIAYNGAMVYNYVKMCLNAI